MRPGVVGPAAMFVGVLPVLARDSQVGSDCLVETFIFPEESGRNSGKTLEKNTKKGRVYPRVCRDIEGAEKRKARRRHKAAYDSVMPLDSVSW